MTLLDAMGADTGDVPSSPSKDRAKQELPPGLQKICLVCGDKALGYNFNAVSCESCKAFFRRNALVSKEFKCPFSNSCEITVVTRRFCQRCRLEKCLAVGMVKEFIMTDEDKAEKRKKIEENRAKKRSLRDHSVSSSKSARRDEGEGPGLQYDVLSTTGSPVAAEPELQPLIYDTYSTSADSQSDYYLLYHQKKYLPHEEKVFTQQLAEVASVADSSTADFDQHDPHHTQDSIRGILTQGEASAAHVCEQLPARDSRPGLNKAQDILQDVERIEPNSMESILCEAIKLEFESYTTLGTCSGTSRELNEVERAKLNELIVANKALHAPIDDDLSLLVAPPTALKGEEGAHDPELITIVNLTAVAIRRLIKMAKKIGAFRNMCEEDQVALLKGGCTEMMVLRSTMTYDGQKDTWKLPHSKEQYGSIRTDVLKKAKGNIYQAHERFIRTFQPQWRQDEHVILILSAILLFTPQRPRVVHADVVKLEQNSYYYLLRRYLESVYPGCEAKSTFLKLIQKVMELRKLAEEVTGVYLDVNPLEPLLIEIFDLKHQAA